MQSCVVQTDALVVGSADAGANLASQITEALTVSDATLATGQKVLLRELVALSDEAVAELLVDVASNPRTSPLLPDARSALAAQRMVQVTCMPRWVDTTIF